MRRATRGVGAVVVLLGLATASPGVAQDPDTVPPGRPFVEGGVHDKPYLLDLAGRTAIGGYAEAHARYERVDGATETLGFEARRFNLFTSTRVSDFVRISGELEIEDGGEEITLEYAAIDVALHPQVNLRAGMVLVPLGRFNLAHDSPRNEFTDRPVVSTELLGVALSQPGLGLFGLVSVGERGRLTWEAYAVNGFDSGILDASADGTRLPAGSSNLQDENASPSVVGRVAWSPSDALELGLSGYRGAYNVSEADGIRLDDRRYVNVGVLDFTAARWGLRMEGEAALVRVDVPEAMEAVFAEAQRGFYVQGRYDFGAGRIPAMPSSSFSAGLRLDVVDFDAGGTGDSLEQVSVGVGFRPSAETVLKLDWVRGRGFDPFANQEDFAGVLFSVATYF